MGRYPTEHDYLKEFQAVNESIHDYFKLHPIVKDKGSQANEDAILAELLPDPAGLYVDVGAYHPWDCSNTWQFYKRGWRGLLVEPVPMFQARLLRQRPGDAIFPVAASNQAGFAVLRFCGSVSTIQEDWPIEAQKHVIVETMTLTEVIRKFPGFMRAAINRGGWDLCSVDVEGHERQALEGIDFSVFRPKVFCVEYLSYTDDNTGIDLSPTWEHLLLSQGYELYATTTYNKIYRVF